jgi:hypothetical protein
VVQLSHDIGNLKGMVEMTKKEILVVLVFGLIINVGGYLCAQKWLRHDVKKETATSGRR